METGGEASLRLGCSGEYRRVVAAVPLHVVTIYVWRFNNDRPRWSLMLQKVAAEVGSLLRNVVDRSLARRSYDPFEGKSVKREDINAQLRSRHAPERARFGRLAQSDL